MKKIIAFLLAGMFVVTIVSCGISDISDDSTTDDTHTDVPTKSSDSTDMSTDATDTPDDKDDEFHDFESAQAFVEDMGIGWNLGNTLDPVECTWVNNDLDYETAWGNPKTSKKLISYIKEQGFDTIRIPVTWANHIGQSPEYTISPTWMKRVQQVVDWCIEEDLYVIINMHHEGGWLTKASTDYDNVMIRYKAIWTQIAEQFKGYSEKLVFESMNEIGFDDLGTQKGCKLMNQINTEFTELIRSTGGNNEKRYLLLAGYWTDMDRCIEGRITMPDDDRTILSVHYYSPSTFAIADSTSTWGYQRTWGTKEDFEYLEGQMKKMKQHYVDCGTPVIIGEFGTIHTDKDMEDVVLYTSSIIEYALKYHMCPIWWDNGSEIDRTGLSFKVSGMQEAVMAAKERGLSARLDK